MDGPLIDQIQLTVEGILIKPGVARLQKQLAHHRLSRPGGIPQGTVIGRHIAPADDLHPFFSNDPLHDMTGTVALGCLGRGEQHRNTVFTRLRQTYAQRGTDLAQEGVRHLQQDTGSVTGIMFAANSAAVVKVGQNGQCLLHNIVRLFPFDVCHKTNTTGIVLKRGIVEALFFRYSDCFHVCNPYKERVLANHQRQHHW